MPRAVTPPTDARTQPAGLEPGSFRDPESRVFYDGDEVFRALSPDGLSDFEALQASRACSTTSASCATELVEDGTACGPRRGLLVHEPAGVLRHERIPFVSYPYEWTFSMLRDAALRAARPAAGRARHDLVLKDSTPYNVQFKGARPVFVDIGLLRAPARGRAVGRLPPVLHAVPLPAAAPGREGRAVPSVAARRRSTASRRSQMRDLLSFRDRFRRGVFTQRLPARAARGPLRRPARPGQAGGQARLQEGAVRRQRAQDAQAGRAPAVGPAAGRLDRLRRAQQLHRRRRAPQGRVRPPGRHVAARGTSSGTSAPTTAATRASPPRAPRR